MSKLDELLGHVTNASPVANVPAAAAPASGLLDFALLEQLEVERGQLVERLHVAEATASEAAAECQRLKNALQGTREATWKELSRVGLVGPIELVLSHAREVLAAYRKGVAAGSAASEAR